LYSDTVLLGVDEADATTSSAAAAADDSRPKSTGCVRASRKQGQTQKVEVDPDQSKGRERVLVDQDQIRVCWMLWQAGDLEHDVCDRWEYRAEEWRVEGCLTEDMCVLMA